MGEEIKTSLDVIVGFIKGVDSALDNPGKNLLNFLFDFFKDLLIAFNMVSFDILVVVGFFALLFYIFGWKKGKSVAWMCPAIYIVLQIITQVLS